MAILSLIKKVLYIGHYQQQARLLQIHIWFRKSILIHKLTSTINIIPIMSNQLILFFVFPYPEDPCSTKECPLFSECTLDANFKPRCTCVRRCPLIFDPVCASNGETFANECAFKIQACSLNGSLAILHQGYCSECFYLKTLFLSDISFLFAALCLTRLIFR